MNTLNLLLEEYKTTNIKLINKTKLEECTFNGVDFFYLSYN